MAKQSIVERERKRQRLVLKYAEKRKIFLQEFALASKLEDKLKLHQKIQELPRNSSRVRLRNRCWRTGRGRGFYRDFGLSRHMIREMAHNCILPGIKKASW